MNYPYLRAWNVLLASPTEYNVSTAREEHAPENAIYRKHARDEENAPVTRPGWQTVEDIVNPAVKAQVIALAKERFGAS